MLGLDRLFRRQPTRPWDMADIRLMRAAQGMLNAVYKDSMSTDGGIRVYCVICDRSSFVGHSPSCPVPALEDAIKDARKRNAAQA